MKNKVIIVITGIVLLILIIGACNSFRRNYCSYNNGVTIDNSISKVLEQKPEQSIYNVKFVKSDPQWITNMLYFRIKDKIKNIMGNLNKNGNYNENTRNFILGSTYLGLTTGIGYIEMGDGYEFILYNDPYVHSIIKPSTSYDNNKSIIEIFKLVMVNEYNIPLRDIAFEANNNIVNFFNLYGTRYAPKLVNEYPELKDHILFLSYSSIVDLNIRESSTFKTEYKKSLSYVMKSLISIENEKKFIYHE